MVNLNCFQSKFTPSVIAFFAETLKPLKVLILTSGKKNILEELIEERIESICERVILEYVLAEIKKVHPYEELVIDIYPVYEIGRKKAKAHSGLE